MHDTFPSARLSAILAVDVTWDQGPKSQGLTPVKSTAGGDYTGLDELDLARMLLVTEPVWDSD